MKIRLFTWMIIMVIIVSGIKEGIITAQPVGKNLSRVATISSSIRYGGALMSLNDGLIPRGGALRSGGGRSLQRPATQWIQYEWAQPVVTNGIAVFWWNYENSLKLPHAYRIKYWNGSDFVPVNNPSGLGLRSSEYNRTGFDDVKTTILRPGALIHQTGFRWESRNGWSFQAPGSPNHPPVVSAGADRSVMPSGKTLPFRKGSIGKSC